jgi:hypothetical protein
MRDSISICFPSRKSSGLYHFSTKFDKTFKEETTPILPKPFQIIKDERIFQISL